MTEVKFVITHRNCYDGKCAERVAMKYYREHPSDVQVLYESFYPGDSVLDGIASLQKKIQADNYIVKSIVMFDVSIKPEALHLLRAISPCVKVYDHHVDTQRAFDGDMPAGVYYTEGVCGAELAWAYYYGENTPTPTLVKYIGDHDCWRWEQAAAEGRTFSKEITDYLYGLLTTHYSSDETWDAYLDKDVWDTDVYGEILAAALAASKIKNNILIRLVPRAKLITHRGVKISIINSPIYQSDIGNMLCKATDAAGAYKCDCAIVWSYDYNRKITDTAGAFSCSMRSRSPGDEHFDVAAFAKQWGGGGHACAAGFAIADVNEFYALGDDKEKN